MGVFSADLQYFRVASGLVFDKKCSTSFEIQIQSEATDETKG